jgi:hypothetical protein
MSGWIKFEKSLVESLRFKRFAKALSRSVTRHVTHGAISDETVAIGGLARLWMYADTHIAENNILEASLDEVDEIAGIEGFAQALPVDWLKVVDANHVELPDFLAHNGTSARMRKLGAERQARYRHRSKDASLRSDVTRRNASRNASNDARPDQTIPRPDVIAASVPHGAKSESRLSFERCRSTYPKGLYTGSAWLMAEREFYRRIDEGASAAELVAAAAEYALQQDALGNTGTQFVMSPAKFFNGTGAWRGPFPLPIDPKASEAGRAQAAKASALEREVAAARAIGCPLQPDPADCAETYATRVRLWRQDQPRSVA